MGRNKKDRSSRLCVVVFPFKNSGFECGQGYLTQYLDILSHTGREITVLAGNYYPGTIPDNVKIINVNTINVGKEKEAIFSQLLRLLWGQIILSLKLINIRKNFDIYNIYMWTGAIIGPSFIAKVLNKQIWLTLTGSAHKSSQKMYSLILNIIPILIGTIERTNYFLADKIFLNGNEHMIADLNLEKYRSKLHPKYQISWVDHTIFSIDRQISERTDIIGYVGRLSPEKGIIQLIHAIPLLISYRRDLKFIIIGDGPLMDECKMIIQTNGCQNNVKFLGWVEHHEISNYLNLMKIHVLPSYTEALGGSGVEAMASGAISIVNSVGGLEDVVEEGITGFILKDNSPETIAKKVIEVLSYPNLGRIQTNASEYIIDNFSYDRVISKWDGLFESDLS